MKRPVKPIEPKVPQEFYKQENRISYNNAREINCTLDEIFQWAVKNNIAATDICIEYFNYCDDTKFDIYYKQIDYVENKKFKEHTEEYKAKLLIYKEKLAIYEVNIKAYYIYQSSAKKIEDDRIEKEERKLLQQLSKKYNK